MADNIRVHGRGGYTALVKRITTDGVQADLSASVVWFEVDDVLRVACVPDAVDTKAQRVTLSRAQVALISTRPTSYAIIDETVAPVVIGEGTISRYAYTETPTA